LTFNTLVSYVPSPEGKKVWELAKHLDTSAPDRDSRRLGYLTRLSQQADDLYYAASKQNQLKAESYIDKQEHIYKIAADLVALPAPKRDADD
jgi:hypothetical protein